MFLVDEASVSISVHKQRFLQWSIKIREDRNGFLIAQKTDMQV